MHFWIVTPSYNHLDWLKLCVESVRDQAGPGVSVHHHVQDACSKDGTREYLAEIARQPPVSGYAFSHTSEADNGMYDAINRGWLKAPGTTDVIAHLNCDEQYLPGALATIARAFETRPTTDVLLADLVVVDRDGRYICHRRALKPYAWMSRFCCVGMTATTFQRASVVQRRGVLFDTSWRIIGDKVWYNALHRERCRFTVIHELTSVFADTGDNLNWTRRGLEEKREYERRYMGGRSFGGLAVSYLLAVRRLLTNWMLPAPTQYAIHRPGGVSRLVCPIKKPRGTWHKRMVVLETGEGM